MLEQPNPNENASASPVKQPFDFEIALERAGGDRALVCELAGIYREQSANLLTELQRALDSCDGRAVARLAHTLKGSSAFFSADAVTASAQKLEEAVDLAGMRMHFDELKAAVDTLWSALEALRAEVSA